MFSTVISFHSAVVGGNGVDPLGRTLLADDLPAEQPPGALLRDQLGGDRRRPGEIAGPGGGLHRRSDVRKPGPDVLGLLQPGTGDLEAADLAHRRTDHAGEGRVAAAEVDPRHPRSGYASAGR